MLWTPDGAAGPRPLILIGHGGGQHKQAPGIVARARRFVAECGFAVVAADVPGHGDRPGNEEYSLIDRRDADPRAGPGELTPLLAAFHALLAAQTVPEWRAVLDAVQELHHVGAGPVGYWGVSLGCGLGVPFITAEPRVRAAVLGLGGAEHRPRPPRRSPSRWSSWCSGTMRWCRARPSLALFDTFGSAEKTLHANPGGHGDVPRFEVDSALRFFTRHLS